MEYLGLFIVCVQVCITGDPTDSAGFMAYMASKETSKDGSGTNRNSGPQEHP